MLCPGAKVFVSIFLKGKLEKKKKQRRKHGFMPCEVNCNYKGSNYLHDICCHVCEIMLLYSRRTQEKV